MRMVGAGLMGVVLCMTIAARADFGDPLPNLSTTEQNAFTGGKTEFATAETPDEGLGPVFNDVSCAACHTAAAGAVGGNTTRTETRFGTIINGMFDPLAQLGGSLMQSQGINRSGVTKGKACAGVKFNAEIVPGSATIVAQRRTTPLFGLGLVDATPDATFKQLARSEPVATRGTVSVVPIIEDGQVNTVGRFGWKAQNGTLHIFAGDAYVNEMGITNPTFPTENCPNGDCSGLQCLTAPELNDPDGADVTAFTDFMTFLAPPPRGPVGPAELAGEGVFQNIGCADCHTPTLKTGQNTSAALSGITYHPYSDFLLHDMGALGDGITQGTATGTLMRTAPLWGVRVQTTLLHDGRAKTVTAAIDAHAGQATAARIAFDGLGATERSQLLAFLASL